MGNFIPRFLQFQGFSLKDLKHWQTKLLIEIYLEATQDMRCSRCGEYLGRRTFFLPNESAPFGHFEIQLPYYF